MPMPFTGRTIENPWPFWPFNLKTTSSHKEGVKRNWSIATKEFVKDDKGNLKALKTVTIEWVKGEPGQRPQLKEVPGSEEEWPCELVLLALGFTGPEKSLAQELGLELDDRTNIKADNTYQTNIPNIFTAGDMHRGQSLIVWAISEGREAARHVDEFLTGHSGLPTKGEGDLPTV
jgi:glutamate synthase (NADPH/NADH) small chain